MANYDESLRSITLNAAANLAILTGAPGLPGSVSGTASNGVANQAGNQYRAVVVSGVRIANLSNANNGGVVGILQNKPQHTGDAATIGFSGVSRVMMTTNINAGQVVFCAADGTGSNSNATAVKLGVALDSSTSAGSLVPVLLQLGE
jgi:hypothetical protein